MSKILEVLNSINLRLGSKSDEVKTDTKEVEVKLGMIKTADGELQFEYEGEELVAGVKIFAIGEDNERVPLPEGEYPLEGGKVVTVDAEGTVTNVGAEAVKEEEAPAEMNEAEAGTVVNSDSNPLKDLAEIKSILIKYQEETKAKQDATAKEIKDLKEKLVELSKQPASKPIKATPTESGRKLTLTERLNNKL